MSQISWLTPREAQEARDELLAALGTENNPGQWMRFMGAVTKRLPDVLSPGKPSKAAIERSIIGQLGFKSWKEMVETPTDRDGLGWSVRAWSFWREAWKVVQERPYLLDLPVTAAEVNRIAKATKDDPEGFPANPEALEAWKDQHKSQRQEQRAETLEALKTQVSDLANQVKTLEKERDQGQANNQTLREQLAEVSQRLEGLATDLGQANADRAHLHEALEASKRSHQQTSNQLQKTQKRLKQYQNLTAWDHLKKALGLG